MSRPYTEDEVRDQFLEYIHLLINYWKGVDKPACQDKMEGLAFSFLSMLDGCAAALPGFK